MGLLELLELLGLLDLLGRQWGEQGDLRDQSGLKGIGESLRAYLPRPKEPRCKDSIPSVARLR